MLVVAAPLLGLALGAAFAWASSEELSRGAGVTSSRSLVVSALFGFLVHAPACGYFQAFFPDWSYAYFVDAAHRPAVLDLVLVLVDALSVPVGFVLLSGSAATGHTSTIARAVAAPVIVTLVLLALSLSRLRVFATYAEFHGDFGTEPLSGSPVGYALIWMTSVDAGAAAWTLRALRRLSATDSPGTGRPPTGSI
jgi:hypothetical protein